VRVHVGGVTDLAPPAASVHPPERIETARLVLRRWRSVDAPLLRAAIDASLPELHRWMPWARDEPVPVDALARRLATFEEAWDAGREFAYGIFPLGEREAYGSAGIHRRGDDRDSAPDHLEIGYWIRSDATGRGYATEAARALVDAAARLPGTPRVEIRCDPTNVRSAAVARRLGLRHARTIPAAEILVDGAPRDTMVWEWS
jgi:RimJ/RimL family protein N-acetyltransferase